MSNKVVNKKNNSIGEKINLEDIWVHTSDTCEINAQISSCAAIASIISPQWKSLMSAFAVHMCGNGDNSHIISDCHSSAGVMACFPCSVLNYEEKRKVFLQVLCQRRMKILCSALFLKNVNLAYFKTYKSLLWKQDKPFNTQNNSLFIFFQRVTERDCYWTNCFYLSN